MNRTESKLRSFAIRLLSSVVLQDQAVLREWVESSMEIREFAERVLLSPSLQEKLTPPRTSFNDDRPGIGVDIAWPERDDQLQIAVKRRSARMPHRSGLCEPRLRAVAHHIMANHELQALEVMARTLLAFPDAPTEFRQGVARVMVDEQRHTKMHMRRLRACGMDFGDLPVNAHVWIRGRAAENIMEYLACLPLTFENGNLDLSLEFADAFGRAGDQHSRNVMLAIHQDEIDHVSLGVQWLRRFKRSDQSDWLAYVRHLRPPLQPHHAKGKVFQWNARRASGMDDAFIDQIMQATSARPARLPNPGQS